MRIEELIQRIEQTADPSLAADWDQSGMQVAAAKDRIYRLALTLDPRPDNIRKALEWNADFILSHHPLSLSPRLPHKRDQLHTVYTLLFQSGAGLYAAHTSLDVQIQGPAAWLARALHCSHIRPVHPVHPPALIWISLDRRQLPPSPPDEIINHHKCIQWTLSDTELHFLVPESQVRSILHQVAEKTDLDHVRTSQTLFVRAQCGFGVMGELPQPMPCPALLSALASHLPPSAWNMTGSPPEQIRTLAYCPGSGMDLAAQAFALGADLYISGDLKFHQAQELEDLGLTLDVGHFSLEEKMMSVWAQSLGQDLAQAGVEVAFIPGHNPFRRKTCPQ